MKLSKRSFLYLAALRQGEQLAGGLKPEESSGEAEQFSSTGIIMEQSSQEPDWRLKAVFLIHPPCIWHGATGHLNPACSLDGSWRYYHVLADWIQNSGGWTDRHNPIPVEITFRLYVMEATCTIYRYFTLLPSLYQGWVCPSWDQVYHFERPPVAAAVPREFWELTPIKLLTTNGANQRMVYWKHCLYHQWQMSMVKISSMSPGIMRTVSQRSFAQEVPMATTLVAKHHALPWGTHYPWSAVRSSSPSHIIIAG